MTDKSNKKASRKAAALIDNCSLEDMKRINATWVAQKIGVHPSYLSRIFKEDQDCHLKDYIERAKMNKAQELLETTDWTVKKIATLLDYTNPGYFSSKFHQHKGMSPKRCREQYHARQEEQSKKPAAVSVEPAVSAARTAPTAPADSTDSENGKPLLEIIKNRIIKHFKGLFGG
ncbi:MAG: two-component system, response regulator YesN [Acidobacteriota bacterium]|nr:two-component system, response regulator YesN [Acidobacteriota bacterium]